MQPRRILLPVFGRRPSISELVHFQQHAKRWQMLNLPLPLQEMSFQYLVLQRE
uniref:Uncharacterized protein n=1 Tax=Kalanchoe fedtschenkoi TaxID=63787 RepID=A0A7N0TRV9_KALFE